MYKNIGSLWEIIFFMKNVIFYSILIRLSFNGLQIFAEEFMFQKIFSSCRVIANTCKHHNYNSLFFIVEVESWSLELECKALKS